MVALQRGFDRVVPTHRQIEHCTQQKTQTLDLVVKVENINFINRTTRSKPSDVIEADLATVNNAA